MGGYIELSTPGHLEWVRASSSRWGSNYRLTADIDMASCAVWNTTIGDGAVAYSRHFDGNNKTIRNLTITKSANYVGLLGYLSSARVSDLTLESIDINATGQRWVGTLAGVALNGTTIERVTVLGAASADVSGGTDTAGLVGLVGAAASVTDASSDVNVTSSTGSQNVGGLVGVVDGSMTPAAIEINRSSATGTVTVIGGLQVGGLAGNAVSADIENSHATGSVSGASDTGGLVGYMLGVRVRTSFATGDVTGSVDETGGLVGSSMSGSSIQQSYATGDVTGVLNVGGLAGFSAGLVDESYSTGAVTGTSQVGGFIGFVNGGTTTDSYWDVETSGQSRGQSANPDVATGLTTEQMQTATSFTGWSISEGYSAAATWGLCSRVNSGYPFLTAFFSADPCTDAPSVGAPSYAQFVFTLPDGRECSAIGPVTVEIGREYALPSKDAQCRTSPESRIDGWTIPVSPGFTGAGSNSLPFQPGHVVDVSGSQQFSAVLWEPILRIHFDANVAQADECRANASGETSNVPRTDDQWVPRSIAQMARFPMAAPCTPPGHQLAVWNTRGDGTGEVFAAGSPLPESWHMNGPNVRNLYAIWKPE